MCNFHPVEVVGRGSKTQLQVGWKLSTPSQLSGPQLHPGPCLWKPRFPANTERWRYVHLVLVQHLRRWPNIKSTLGQRLVCLLGWLIQDLWQNKSGHKTWHKLRLYSWLMMIVYKEYYNSTAVYSGVCDTWIVRCIQH